MGTVLAVTAGKLAARMTRIFHLGAGTSLPGKIARQVQPDILGRLSRQIAGPVIAVTGTNGKTTTCGLLAQFARESGRRVVHNQLGANMVGGIAAALVQQADMAGRLSADLGVLEVDEASLKGVAAEVPIQYVVVSNLFRDQLDRYGELDTTARLIAEGIAGTAAGDAGGCVFLNADDPIVTGLGRSLTHVVYFGVDAVTYEHPLNPQPPLVAFAHEVTNCPQCAGPLAYSQVIFGHLGHYRCPACRYERPTPQVLADRVVVKPECSEVSLRIGGAESMTLTLPLPGLFNVYNLLAALAVALRLAIAPEQLRQGLAHYQSVFGRAERKIIQGKAVMVMLIKNPVGASEVLKQVAGDPNGRLMIAINDNYADGRDVSWLWDAMFEVIQTDKPIVVSGVRAEDMAVRLKYAGVAEHLIQTVPDLKTAVAQAVQQTQPHETLYLLPTYTALLNLRTLL